MFTDYTVPLAFLVFLNDHKLFYLFYIVILKIIIKKAESRTTRQTVYKSQSVSGLFIEKFSAGVQYGVEDLTP